MAKRGDRDEDRSAFETAMRGVKPIKAPDTVRPKRPSERAIPQIPAEEAPVRFEIVRTGERTEATAPGIDRKHLRRLRAGRVAIETRIDLHGLHSVDARETVRRALVEAAEAGRRCALVVHGRGRHSQGDAVLKEALPVWLAEPPVGSLVMAFASATPADGGAGATYVLLRRRVVRKPG